MNSKIFVALVLFSLVLVTSQQGEQSTHKKLNIPTSKVGEIIKGVNYKVDQGRSFQLIRIQSIDKKYLFIQLKADQIYEHLELSLTIFKEGSQTPLKRCFKQEIDSCYIPKFLLQNNETLFLVIESAGQECDYQLRTYWSDLEHIYMGTQIKFMFSKNQQKQIYHLQLDNKPFNQLRIIIKPETRRYAFDKIKMYGTFGKDSLPSATNYDFKSVYLWQDAQGIYLNKKQLKQMNMNLILEGQIQTVYTMRCDLVTEDHHNLLLNDKIYQFLQKGETYDYQIQFKNQQGKLLHDLYVVTIAIFTGDLNFQFYSDKQKTKRIPDSQPFMYMGDIQYVLRKQQIQTKMPNGLFIKAISKNRTTTFMMQFEGRQDSKLFQLHQHIYEFMQVKNSSVSYFKITKYEEKSKENPKDLKIVVSLVQVLGRVGAQFRKCTSSFENCTSQLYNAHSSKIESQYRNVGSKQTYSLTLAEDFWKNVNLVQKEAVILVVLSNQEQNRDSFSAIEYSVGNRIEFLRQNKPIQSHVLKNEMKTYKFVNTDPSIQKIRIHINKISGCFNTYIFKHDPSNQQLQKDSNKVSGSLYQTTDKLTQEPIIVIIRGEDSATYSLVVQPVYKNQNQINYITLSEDLQFKIKIGPNKYQILEITPIQSSIYFNYKSSGAVHACALKNNVCEDKQANFSNQGQINVPGFHDRVLYIKLRNPSSSKSIEVSSIFHSTKRAHCQLKKMGHLYKQVVSEGTCFMTTIDEARDFQVLIIREQIGQLSYTMTLCDKFLNFAIKDNGEQKYLISSDQIKLNCNGHAEYSFFLIVAGKQTTNVSNPTNIHLKYLVQFTSSMTILPDGIGYHGTQLTTEQPLKKFVYPILNKIETNIILSTQKKLFFLVKVVEAAQRDKTVISINQYDFTSPSERFYYLQSVHLKITQDDLKKFTCQQCQMIIYVYSKQEVGTTVDFTIQVTQNFVVLTEGVPKSGYLVQNSKAYYGYKVKQAGSLLVEVSDNNKDCAQLYLSSMEYPDEKRHLEKSYDGQIILDVFATTKNYYITVKARKNCAYIITTALTQGKNHIVKLQRGALGYCNLAQNETKLYTFKHLTEKSFKIISLHKYGQVDFYLNRTSPEQILQFLKKPKVSLDQFSYQSDFKNRLILNKGDKQLCKGCHYIIAVHAKKHTESSIFLGDEETKIPLSDQKVLNDILPKSSMITRGQFYYIQKGILQVKVHSGKLQVEILYKDQSIKKTFEKGKVINTHNFTLSEEKGYHSSATAIYTALQDNTVYSSRIKSIQMVDDDGNGTHYSEIDPNQPSYVYLIKNQLHCVKGYIKRADERLFISFYTDDKDTAKGIKIVGKLNNNFTRVSQDTTRNVISITFIDAANQMLSTALPYELCLLHDNSSLSLNIMQSEQTSLLPENIETLVVSKQIYDIYPEGDFLLDIFECRGTAKVAYGATKKQLLQSKPKILDMMGMPDQSHAIKVQKGYSNLLLSVQSELSIIRWLKIDEQKQKGLGYYVYKAGNLKYNTVFGQIQFLVDPVKQVKKSKTKLSRVRYNLYISNSEEDLKYASHCERYLPESVMEIKITYQSLNENTFRFTVHKYKLTEKYGEAQNLFFIIVADLTIKTPDESLQQYRFIYKSQELPSIVFIPNQLQKYDFTTLIIALVLFIAAIIILSWLFVKVIAPMIARLRNRLLVEENALDASKQKKEENDDKMQEVPPSSDRQGIHFNNQLETEDKM